MEFCNHPKFQFILNFLFPPRCLACGRENSTKVFCQNCWLLCALPDPLLRCRHCFEEIDEEEKLCKTCRFERRLSIPRAFVFDPLSPARLLGLDETDALAGFAILQWIQLEWDFPDAIIPMPDSCEVALAFAIFLEIPLVQALTRRLEMREGRLEEEQTLLLFDVSNSISDLQKASVALKDSFPKKIYCLSLFPYADSHP